MGPGVGFDTDLLQLLGQPKVTRLDIINEPPTVNSSLGTRAICVIAAQA